MAAPHDRFRGSVQAHPSSGPLWKLPLIPAPWFTGLGSVPGPSRTRSLSLPPEAARSFRPRATDRSSPPTIIANGGRRCTQAKAREIGLFAFALSLLTPYMRAISTSGEPPANMRSTPQLLRGDLLDLADVILGRRHPELRPAPASIFVRPDERSMALRLNPVEPGCCDLQDPVPDQASSMREAMLPRDAVHEAAVHITGARQPA